MKVGEVVKDFDPARYFRTKFISGYRKFMKSPDAVPTPLYNALHSGYSQIEEPERRGKVTAAGVMFLKWAAKDPANPNLNNFSCAIEILDTTGNLHTSHYVGTLLKRMLEHLKQGGDYQRMQNIVEYLETYTERRKTEKK